MAAIVAAVAADVAAVYAAVDAKAADYYDAVAVVIAALARIKSAPAFEAANYAAVNDNPAATTYASAFVYATIAAYHAV